MTGCPTAVKAMAAAEVEAMTALEAEATEAAAGEATRPRPTAATTRPSSEPAVLETKGRRSEWW